MTHCENRDLRKELYVAYNTRSSEIGPNAGKWDNAKVMEEILSLRYKEAKLLGFESYAHLSLATKMADTPETVINFLEDLAKKSHAQGEKKSQHYVNMLKRMVLMIYSHGILLFILRNCVKLSTHTQKKNYVHISQRIK